MNSSAKHGRQPLFAGLLMIFLIGVAVPGWADVFKCRTPAGKVEISNQPCTAGSKTEATQRDEVISPERKQAAEQDLKRAKEFLAEREAAQAAERARQPPATTPPAPPPPPPVAEPPASIVVIDPVARCIADVERLNLSPRRRQEMMSACYPAPFPRSLPPTTQSVTVTTQPRGREPAPACVGKQCPMIGPGR